MKRFNTILSIFLSMVFTAIFLLGLVKFTNANLNLAFVCVLLLISAGIYLIVKHKKNIGIGLILGSIFFVLYIIRALVEMD